MDRELIPVYMPFWAWVLKGLSIVETKCSRAHKETRGNLINTNMLVKYSQLVDMLVKAASFVPSRKMPEKGWIFPPKSGNSK